MSSSRTWSAGTAVVAVLLVIAGWFLLISPQRSAAADLRDQNAAAQAQNDQIKLRTKQLEAQFASLPARQAQLAEIKQQMPDNPALPSLIRDLSTYADSADVTLDSVAPGTPEAVDAAAPSNATPVAPGTAPAGTSSVSTLSAIPTTITATGSYSELTLYLQKLQTQMRRAFLVQTINLAEGDKGSGSAKTTDLQMTLTGDIFVMASPQAATAGTSSSPVAPSAGSVPPSNSSAS